MEGAVEREGEQAIESNMANFIAVGYCVDGDGKNGTGNFVDSINNDKN